MAKSTSSEIVLELIRLISKPSFKRESHEVRLVLPWLKKRSQLLQHQETSVLVDIVKHCTFLNTHHDDIIIKQGERGDSFYVLLRGSVSVYIDPKMTGESADDAASKRGGDKKKKKKQAEPKPPESEDSLLSEPIKTDNDNEPVTEVEKEVNGEEEEEEEHLPQKLVPVDRSKFGKFIVSYGVGESFGEIALVHRDSFRNATIIADDDADLMVIDQELFDRSLRAEQEARYKDIRDFIDAHPFFSHMTLKFKKLLEMSLRKETYIFDTNIVKQGDPVVGLHFIRSGGAQITIEPKKHKHQYLHLWPFEAGVDSLSIEFEHLRELRKAAIMKKYEDPAVWETMPEDIMIKRNEGYAAIEKHMQEKRISLCTVQAKEVLGDVETLLGLSTYMHTVRCTANTECFVLDTKNYERLVGKKNNAQTTDIMRAYVINKLSTRMHMRHADLIPLLGYLHQKLTEQTLPPLQKVEPFKVSKTLPDVDLEMQHLLQYFREGKDVMLIKPGVPGMVYYKELMHQKATNRALQRKSSKAGENIKVGSVYRNRVKRKPRSMLQIREALREMMENELIEIENKKLHKKLKSKQVAQPSTGRTSVNGPSPRSHSVELKMPDESKAVRNIKPSFSNKMKPKSDGKASPVISDTSSENGKTPRKPVLVTEVVKEEQDSQLVLPAIREEKTQEEIHLGTPKSVGKDNGLRELPDTHVSAAKERSSESSFKVETQRKLDIAHSPNLDVVSVNTYKSPEPVKRKSPMPKRQSPLLKSRSPKPESQKTSLKKHFDDNDTNFKASTPKLPAIVIETATDELETRQPTAEEVEAKQAGVKEMQANQDMMALDSVRTEDDTPSPSLQPSMKFVNERIQDRLVKSVLGKSEEVYKDYETSDAPMKLLENRIQAFHIKYGEGHKTKNLPNLRRYKLDNADEQIPERPKPGGKVWIKRRMCKFADSEYLVKDHKHVHYHMVDNIPEFDNVKRTKAIMERILQGAGNDETMFKGNKLKPIELEKA